MILLGSQDMNEGNLSLHSLYNKMIRVLSRLLPALSTLTALRYIFCGSQDMNEGNLSRYSHYIRLVPLKFHRFVSFP